jgi:hypothetical protein
LVDREECEPERKKKEQGVSLMCGNYQFLDQGHGTDQSTLVCKSTVTLDEPLADWFPLTQFRERVRKLAGSTRRTITGLKEEWRSYDTI